ncbi:MAG TPA: hypothetical protein PLU50_09110 [Pseudobdellovibrionaceae bacterium]|nr:hypothetical protein [Pseudobdellovibrionaceae bacterium]
MRFGLPYVLCLVLICSLDASAEYRVFRLEIRPRQPRGQDKGTPAPNLGGGRVVLSTLDPQQYREFYPVSPQDQVTYTRTWRCFGDTSGFQALCPDPRPKGNSVPNKTK